MDAISYSLAAKAIKGLENKVDLNGNAVSVPVGGNSDRPVLSSDERAIRFNTDVGGLEEWTGTEWKNISANISAVSLKGTDTEANILALTGMVAEDLWIASDTLNGWVYDGTVWVNIGPLQGPQGVQGVEGKSAYDVAVENGFVGTEAQWLTSLIGATGATGDGIASITKTGTTGLVDTYTVTMTSGATATFTVTNGLDGVDGLDVDHISKTSGTGAAGTVDVYTVWGDVAETINLGTFNVYNGLNGAGTVAGVVAGDNVTVDNTDPTTPIVGLGVDVTIQGNTFNGPEQLVKLDVDGKLPILDGSNLTGIDGLPDQTGFAGKYLKTDGTIATWESASTGTHIVNKPTITSPINGAVDFIGSITSTYSTNDSYVGVQDWVLWEASTDEDFTNIVNSYEGNGNLTSWTPDIGGLDITTIYTRTKQGSDGHRSEYSEIISFTTPNIYIDKPTLTVEGAPASVTLTPLLTGSAFEVTNGTDTHASTDWRVTRSDDGTTVWESLGDTINKTSITTEQLPINTELIFKVRYNSSMYGSSEWTEVTAQTLDIYVQDPVLTVAGYPDGLSLSPALSASSFVMVNGIANHISSDWEIRKASDDSLVWSSIGDTVNKASIAASGLEVLTQYKVRVKYNSDLYGSSSWVEVIGTTLDIYVVTPTLTVQGHPLDIGKNPTLTTSAFTVYNGSDVHLSTDYQVLKNSDGSLVWESLGNTANKLTINSGDLVESTEYRFRARHNSTNYGSSEWVEVIGTTKVVFSLAYGLTWDNIADTYTRTGITISNFSTDENSVQRLMRRCVLNTNGTVNYYLSATDSTKREDGVTAADLTGASGNVMVEIPKFYCKYDDTTGAKNMSISLVPEAGYVVHPAFVKNGVEVNYRYYRAYKGSVNGSKLISRSGVAAANNETIAAFRAKARANGTGWGLVDWNLLFAVQTLCFIEIGTFNSQSILGNGNDTGSDYGMTTGGSNSIGNASSSATNDDTWMSYRGIENFYADIFEWIDGINFSERLVYTSNTQSTFASDIFTGAYTSTGITLPNSGYIKDMSFSVKGFIPTDSTGGSDSTYVTDYVYSNSGARVATFGGFAGNGLRCGAAYLYANLASSYADVAVGAGISF